MGLPQKAIEDCFKLKTEVSSRINRISNKIRDWSRDLDDKQKLRPMKVQPGPLNPNCVLAEEDFSPSTPLTEDGNSTAPTKERELLRLQQK